MEGPTVFINCHFNSKSFNQQGNKAQHYTTQNGKGNAYLVRYFSFQPMVFRNKQEHKLKGIKSQSFACVSYLHPIAAYNSMMLLFRIWVSLALVFIPVIWSMDSFCCSSNRFEYEYNFLHKLITLEQRCTEFISISDNLTEQMSSLQSQLSGKFVST